jgi:hypothetical protein
VRTPGRKQQQKQRQIFEVAVPTEVPTSRCANKLGRGAGEKVHLKNKRNFDGLPHQVQRFPVHPTNALILDPMTEPSRHFPAPWRADKTPGGYAIRDATGKATLAKEMQAKVLTPDVEALDERHRQGCRAVPHTA